MTDTGSVLDCRAYRGLLLCLWWIVNPPPRSGWGIIEMVFVCPSVCVSVCPWILCPSVRPSVLPWHSCRSISPEPFERFSLNFGQMFASVDVQPCQLKVKVTGQGHGFEPWISCPLHISYTPGRIFFKRWSYVCLSETMCRTHNSTMPSQGQGHSSRSCLNLEFRLRAVSPIPVEGFSLTLVKCSP